MISIVLCASLLPSHVSAREESEEETGVQDVIQEVIEEEPSETVSDPVETTDEEESQESQDSGIPGVYIEGCDHGTVTVKQDVRPGAVFFYRAVAHTDEGYFVRSWSATDANGNNLILMDFGNAIDVLESDTDITIRVVFWHDPYTVEVIPNEHCNPELFVNGEKTTCQDNMLSVLEGDTVSVKAVPEEGYELDGIAALNTREQEIGRQLSDDEYAFTMISESVKVVTETSLKTLKVRAGECEHAHVSFQKDGCEATSARKGDTVQAVIDIDQGFHLASVEVIDGHKEHVSYDSETGCFTMPGTDVTVNVYCEKDKGVMFYADENGEEYAIYDYKNIDESRVGNFKDGWFVVDHDFVVNGRMTAKGDVNLILCDGATMTVKHGITVSTGNSLTIWGQKEGSGTLNAGSDEEWYWSSAGIGGEEGQSSGLISIHSGRVFACGGRYGAGIGGGNRASGNVNIYGGVVSSTGGVDGAGIGGGEGGDGGTINIYGGKVTAYGNDSAAGIGGGEDGNGGTITICGGDIYAEADKPELIVDQFNGAGAGIGGGDEGKGGNITIYDGDIESVSKRVTFEYAGAGIGGGDNADGGYIYIYGGKIVARSIMSHVFSRIQGAGIGGGDGNSAQYIYVGGGIVEAHGNQAFGGGVSGNPGTLDLADDIYAASGDHILPYENRYADARLSDITLRKA